MKRASYLRIILGLLSWINPSAIHYLRGAEEKGYKGGNNFLLARLNDACQYITLLQNPIFSSMSTNEKKTWVRRGLPVFLTHLHPGLQTSISLKILTLQEHVALSQQY